MSLLQELTKTARLWVPWTRRSLRSLSRLPLNGLIVDVKETYQIAERLDQCNVAYSLSLFDSHTHWQTQWEVYGEDKIYSWFLGCNKHQIK